MTADGVGLAVYASGRRLHQLATIGLLRSELAVTAISSPDPAEAVAAQQRYLSPGLDVRGLGGRTVVTSVLDDLVVECVVRNGTTLVLVPPVSLHPGSPQRWPRGCIDRFTVEALANGDIRCLPPVGGPTSSDTIHIRETVPVSTLLSVSWSGDVRSALLDRAAWALAGVLEPHESAAVHIASNDDLDVRLETHSPDGRVYGAFASTPGAADSLTFEANGRLKSTCRDYTADTPGFLDMCVAWPLHHRQQAVAFALRYLDTLRSLVLPAYST